MYEVCEEGCEIKISQVKHFPDYLKALGRIGWRVKLVRSWMLAGHSELYSDHCVNVRT